MSRVHQQEHSAWKDQRVQYNIRMDPPKKNTRDKDLNPNLKDVIVIVLPAVPDITSSRKCDRLYYITTILL